MASAAVIPLSARRNPTRAVCVEMPQTFWDELDRLVSEGASEEQIVAHALREELARIAMGKSRFNV